MTNRVSYILWAASYWIRTKLFRKELPFIGGLVLNESCNLNCSHCRVGQGEHADLTYDEACDGLRTFYDMGIRSVFIEGGEPFLWRDGDRRLEDVVQAARRIGFRTVSIYTNGTFPIDVSTDSVFVSLDGLKETNDRLRGPVFDRAMDNIDRSSHPNILINYTINAENRADVEPFCREVQGHPNIRGVFFYFHTPYYGMDDLFLDLEEKRKIVGQLIELKRRGFPILNSRAALKAVARDDWERPSKLCYVYACNRLYQCCRAFGREEACANCGYLGYTEIVEILKLRPSAIWSALRYIPSTRRAAR